MPLSVQHVGDIRRTVEIPFDGETLKVTYRLAAINSKLHEWTQQHGREIGSLKDWLAKVIASWDILDNGTPIPITRESMDRYELPTPLLQLIKDAIDEDSDEKNLRASYAGGSPTT